MNKMQRRRYSRVRFQNGATFQLGDRQWPCEVQDLSLRGALINVSLPPDVSQDAECLLELMLNTDATVRMEGHIAHRYGSQIGIVCDETDVDSVSHLRRLLSMNLGDASLLDREFSALLMEHT